jgi:hypothetical protein
MQAINNQNEISDALDCARVPGFNFTWSFERRRGHRLAGEPPARNLPVH